MHLPASRPQLDTLCFCSRRDKSPPRSRQIGQEESGGGDRMGRSPAPPSVGRLSAPHSQGRPAPGHSHCLWGQHQLTQSRHCTSLCRQVGAGFPLAQGRARCTQGALPLPTFSLQNVSPVASPHVGTSWNKSRSPGLLCLSLRPRHSLVRKKERSQMVSRHRARRAGRGQEGGQWEEEEEEEEGSSSFCRRRLRSSDASGSSGEECSSSCS